MHANDIVPRGSTRRRLLRIVTVIGLLVVPGLSVNSDAAEHHRPNVVFFLADDLGYGDVACFGQDRCKIQTPNFDRLAREGVRFTDAHSIATVCVPSRVSIMTGRYAWRVRGLERGGPWGFLSPRIPPDRFTLARMLNSAGYHTGYVGKWHLGTLMQTKDGKVQGPANVDYTKPLTIGPPQYGLDSSFILPGSLDMYPYAFVRNNKWVGNVTAQKGWSAFNRVGPAAEDFQDVKVLDTFSREAESYIDQRAAAAKQGKPFFLYVALTSPHTPISPRAEFQDKSELGVYGDFVMETDDCLGRVLRALDKHGIADNTLVIATSDHGPASYAGNILKATPGQVHDLEKAGHWPSGIYRGYKFSIYEGGHRVAFAARWPKVAAAGTTCDRLIGLHDLVATVADAAEITIDKNVAADSISYLSLLKDPTTKPTRRSMVFQSTHAWAMREGKWKLCACPGSGALGVYGNVPIPADAWKAAIDKFGRKPKQDELRDPAFVQLFDLEHDPTESHNLASKHPEIVARLFKQMDQQIASGRSTPGPTLKNDHGNINIHARLPKFVLGR